MQGFVQKLKLLNGISRTPHFVNFRHEFVKTIVILEISTLEFASMLKFVQSKQL